ncbi:MAG: erythromycin esterase family protein [Bacteroidaceae bacterium]|nr:erythromycin esterase family protein [Bacteroidaceae bacterium]
MYKEYFCYMLFLLSFCVQSCAQSNDVFISEIEKWEQHPQYSFFRVLKEKDEQKSNDVFILKTRGNVQGKLVRNYPLLHFSKDSIDIDIKLIYKTEKCKSLALVFHSVGNHSEVIGADTVMLPISSEWLENDYSLKVKSGFSLEASLDVIGANESMTGDVYLSDIEITSEGKPLDYNITVPKTRPIPDYYINDFTEFLSSPIMNKRILGIGETVHGTQTLDDIGFKIMKERILYHNCKLIVLEVPTSMGLIFNRFVNNDSRFSLELIEELTKSTLLNSLDFLQWVKEYNKNHNNQISVVGVDDESSFYAGKLTLYSFLNNLNTTGDLNTFIYDIMFDNEINLSTSLLHNRLSKTELNLLRHSINDIKKRNPASIKMYVRDQHMARVVQMLCDTCISQKETATFYGHFLHTNYLTTSHMSPINSTPSMGNFLKDRYGDNYSCIALSAFKGDSWFRTLGNETKLHSLPEAPKTSFEYNISHKKDISFFSMKDLSNEDIFSVRLLGAMYNTNQFFYLTQKERMDGILCVKSVVPISSEYIIDSTPDSKSKQYIDLLLKLK